MADSPFVGEWTITSWVPDPNDPVSDGIPTNAFEVNDILTITQSGQDFALEWRNPNEPLSSVSGLQLVLLGPNGEGPSALQGSNLGVHFAGKDHDVPCNLFLGLEDEILTGIIRVVGATHPKLPETGSGTFTATANAGGTGTTRKP